MHMHTLVHKHVHMFTHTEAGTHMHTHAHIDTHTCILMLTNRQAQECPTHTTEATLGGSTTLRSHSIPCGQPPKLSNA